MRSPRLFAAPKSPVRLSGPPENGRNSEPPTTIGSVFTLSVRSFEGAPSRRQADGAPYGGYIGLPEPPCQPFANGVEPANMPIVAMRNAFRFQLATLGRR